jgi:hypothetical protein
VSESDFVAYPESEDAVDAQEQRREVIERLASRESDKDAVVRWQKLFRGYANEILGARALIELVQRQYFGGQEILCKSSMAQLEDVVHLVDQLAIGLDELIALRVPPCPPGLSLLSEIETIKKSMELRAIAQSLVDDARVDALNVIGRDEAAFDRLNAELKEMARQL